MNSRDAEKQATESMYSSILSSNLSTHTHTYSYTSKIKHLEKDTPHSRSHLWEVAWKRMEMSDYFF